jgi:hypothetical protein
MLPYHVRPVLAPPGGTRIRYAVELRISVTPFGEKENWIMRNSVSLMPQFSRDLRRLTVR